MTNLQPDWVLPWLIKILRSRDEIRDVESSESGVLTVAREFYGSFNLAALAVSQVNKSDVEPIFDTPFNLSFVVNIPSESFWTGHAIEFVESKNAAFGGIGDLYSAISDPDVNTFKPREFEFFERIMNQHDSVCGLVREHDRKYRVLRETSSDVQVVLLNEYELVADRVRVARERYGSFTAILRTNPNGGATTEADRVAKSLHARIFSLREFMGYLGDES